MGLVYSLPVPVHISFCQIVSIRTTETQVHFWLSAKLNTRLPCELMATELAEFSQLSCRENSCCAYSYECVWHSLGRSSEGCSSTGQKPARRKRWETLCCTWPWWWGSPCFSTNLKNHWCYSSHHNTVSVFVLFTHSKFHPSIFDASFFLSSGSRGSDRAYNSCHRTKAGWHPGQVDSYLHVHAWRQTTIYSCACFWILP